MKGGVKKTPGKQTGFTIVEVMVFLAISGLTFLIAAQFINGKEAQAEYTQGMDNINTAVRTIINNVANGNYPLPSTASLSFNCTPGASGPSFSSPASVPPKVDGCAFIGLVVAPEAKTNTSNYTVYSVAGCQFQSCNTTVGAPPSTLALEEPQVVGNMTANDEWPGGLNNNSLCILPAGSTTCSGISTGAIGVFSTLPQQQPGGSTLENGAQLTQLVVFPGTSISSFTAGDIHSTATPLASLYPSGADVIMCFQGLNGKKGSLQIGNENGGGQVETTLGLGQNTASQC